MEVKPTVSKMYQRPPVVTWLEVAYWQWKGPTAHKQERNEVRWRPGQEASLAPSFPNLRSFGSKCTVLKEILVTLLGLFGPPTVIQRPGNFALPRYTLAHTAIFTRTLATLSTFQLF